MVDDESRIRLALRACLEAEGYEVDEAADGVETLDAVRRCPPDLIILDLSMPRLSGLATARELHRLMGADMPRIIVLSAYGSPTCEASAREAGVSAFLEKPLLPDVLRKVVEEVLQQPAGLGT